MSIGKKTNSKKPLFTETILQKAVQKIQFFYHVSAASRAWIQSLFHRFQDMTLSVMLAHE